MNKDFYHQTVTTQQIENYLIEHSGKDLSKVFDQYLRDVRIPILEYFVLDKVMKVIPLRNVFSSLGGLALGLGGLQAAQMFAAPFLLLAKVGAGAYVGNKILLSPQAKRALSGLLRTTDKAIKMSKDKQVIKQLRADRVLIAEALKEGSK